MNQSSVIAIARALQEHRVRYLIVGGLAVVAHGYGRFTADVDLVLDMEPDNLQRALAAFSGMGYRPKVPVPLAHFADPAMRESWIRDKNMKVFSLWNPDDLRTEVDLFVASPFDFERAYAAAERQKVGPDVEATFVGLEELLALKAAAGRAIDMDDIEKLRGVADDRRRRQPPGA